MNIILASRLKIRSLKLQQRLDRLFLKLKKCEEATQKVREQIIATLNKK